MIDHLMGRPSPSWKRTHVFLVILFWVWRIARGDPGAPRLFGLRRLNRALQRFTPWQIIISTLTVLYAFRNLDKILGLDAPEPLANLYSRAYYRATWINIGLDAGFATAMSIRPKWLRDICSPLFSIYYIIYANEADEKLRKFRAVPTVEFLRTTWEKTANPYIRAFLRLPQIPLRRKIHLPRPASSMYKRPITAWLYFASTEANLAKATDLIFDIPGGGFVAMSPEHHEERLRTWALRTGRPVVSLEYGKAPEYPYPFAMDEAFDMYRLLVDSVGTVLGMSGRKLNIIMSGDSAGAMFVVNVIIKILTMSERTPAYPLPVALVLNYPCLDFNITSWMTPAHLRVLRSEHSSGHLPGMKELAQSKDHLSHVSPLSMAGDARPSVRKRAVLTRGMSWKDTLIGLASGRETDRVSDRKLPSLKTRHSADSVRLLPLSMSSAGCKQDQGDLADDEMDEAVDFAKLREQDRPLEARVRFVYPDSPPKPIYPLPKSDSEVEKQQRELSKAVAEANTKATMREGNGKGRLGTRLTMTSRAGYFLDRIIPPTLMRAMAILYIGPHRCPDFATDYHLSPILTPSHLLARFPPLFMQCGEKDPFVDDAVIFAGKVREAKRARRLELDAFLDARTPRSGEESNMSKPNDDIDGPRLTALKMERNRLARESGDDWVQMALFSDWSHGYLQMASIMPEAKHAIQELGDLIKDVFERSSSKERVGSRPRNASPRKARSSISSQRPADPLPSPFASETEAEDILTFVPRKSRPPVLSDDAEPDFTLGGSPPMLGAGDGKRTDSSGSDATLHDDSQDALRLLSCSPDKAADHVRGTARVLAGKKAGHTITETELLRRRRLLDSHIFE